MLKAVFEQPRRLTREQAVKLSVQDIRDFHEEFLLKSGQLLVQNPNEDWHSLAGIKLKVSEALETLPKHFPRLLLVFPLPLYCIQEIFNLFQ